MPVRLPPGRPKLARPPLDRISTNDEHHGNGGGRPLGRRGRTGADRDNDVDLRSDEISRKGGEAFALALGVPLFRGHVLALDPAEGAQSLAKGRDIGCGTGASASHPILTLLACCASAASGAARRLPPNAARNA